MFACLGEVRVESDTVTFRDSTKQEEQTSHHGLLSVYGNSAAGYRALYALNVSTGTGAGYANYGMYGECIAHSRSVGARFDGRKHGLMGVATRNDTSDSYHYGGWFSAGNSDGANYGIYAKTEGSRGTCYAGYFLGSVYCTGSYLPSDSELKTDAAPLEGALSKVMQLKPQTYYFDPAAQADKGLPSSRQYGLYAQELEQVFPEMVGSARDPASADSSAVVEEPQPHKVVNYTALIPVLVKAVQEQQAQVEAQKAEITLLKQELSALKGN